VRTKPLIGRKAWFGPRRFGWGLAPVTAEGWAVVVIAIAAAVILASVDRHARWLGLVVVAVLLIFTFLKGTSPGGPGAWKEFQASRDPNRDS
jgi:MFS-type transporter involved in bile tolerance (Atg22 family)